MYSLLSRLYNYLRVYPSCFSERTHIQINTRNTIVSFIYSPGFTCAMARVPYIPYRTYAHRELARVYYYVETSIVFELKKCVVLSREYHCGRGALRAEPATDTPWSSLFCLTAYLGIRRPSNEDT